MTNWIQKTVCAQQTLESIVIAVAMGNLEVNTAITQLQIMNVPALECCSVIMSAYQVYPQGQMALDSLSSSFGCIQVMQQQQMTSGQEPEPEPKAEQPMETSSVDVGIE